MIDQFYAAPSSWERLRLGPPGPYIDAYAQHLSERGYIRPAARRKIRVVAGLSRWLKKKRGVEQRTWMSRSCRTFSGTGVAKGPSGVKRRRSCGNSSRNCRFLYPTEVDFYAPKVRTIPRLNGTTGKEAYV